MIEYLFKEGYVLPFDKKSFSHFLKNDHISETHINAKANFIYLFNYLKNLGALTILKEESLVSRDFLDSYSGYIIGSYEKYTKYSHRLHFFSVSFDEEEMFTELGKNQSSRLNEIIDSYLGFITVRPIPNSIIGLTILNPSKEISKKELFGIREYKVNLLGREKKIETLAYIEQDRQTSACATASIWYVLNFVAISPRFYLKSPIDITMSTGLIAKGGGRLFPNNGLDPYQITLALKMSGLETQKSTLDPIKYKGRNKQSNKLKELLSLNKNIEVQSSDVTKILYSYSGINIPMIMILKVKYGKLKPQFHAVAVVGNQKFKYNFERKPNNNVYLISDDAKIFYTIDDHFGPFAKYEFNGNTTLKCPWNYNFQTKEQILTEDNLEIVVSVKHVICPLFPKIKVELNHVLKAVTTIDVMFRTSLIDQGKNDNNRPSMHWDIKLLFSREYKESMFTKEIHDSIRRKTLISLYPKYIWVAKLYYGDSIIFDFIFDATALSNSCFLLDICEYNFPNPEFGEELRLTLYNNKDRFTDLFQLFDKEIWINRVYHLLNVENCFNKDVGKDICQKCFNFEIR